MIQAFSSSTSDAQILPESRLAKIDAEDPSQSSWARYINHCDAYRDGCNCGSQVNAADTLIWFRALRDIQVGEEICFSCASRQTRIAE